MKPYQHVLSLLTVLIGMFGAGAPATASDWPNGARAAVTLSFDVDGETLWWDDKDARQGDRSPVSQGQYGPRIAVYRVLDLLSRHDVTASFFIPSWIAETYPEMVRAIAARGHEIGAHGVVHVPPTQLEPAEELRRLQESIAVLERLTGKRPAGYRAPAWAVSDVTLELTADEGFLYSSNLMDADLPYVHTDPAGLVELPVSWVLDDAPHFWFDENSWNKTIRSAAEVDVLWREEFEAIYAEGGYYGLTMHPQIIGRPARLAMLDQLIGWIKEFDGVWITTCDAVAEHIREQDGR